MKITKSMINSFAVLLLSAVPMTSSGLEITGTTGIQFDPPGGETVDKSCGNISIEHFNKLKGLNVINFDSKDFKNNSAINEISVKPADIKLKFTGFIVSREKDYLTSVPNCLMGIGTEKKCSSSIEFSRPVQFAGMTVQFAWGTIEVRFLGSNSEVLFSREINGKGEIKQAGWQDFFFSYQAEYAAISKIEFIRSNIASRPQLAKFGIDDLGFSIGKTKTIYNIPSAKKEDLIHLQSSENRNVCPAQNAQTIEPAEHDNDYIVFSGINGFSYRFKPTAGLFAVEAGNPSGKWQSTTPEMQILINGKKTDWKLISCKIAPGRVNACYDFTNKNENIKVNAELSVKGNSLLMQLESSDCVPLEIKHPEFDNSIAIGQNDTLFWGYYGKINYFPESETFMTYIPDWSQSNCSIIQPDISYIPNQDGKCNPLKELLVFNTGSTVDSVLPSIPNKPSPYRRKIANSMFVEWWYDNFDKLGEMIDLYHQYGMDDIIVLVHRWQRHGFDTKLPEIMPPNPARGGVIPLKNAIHSGLKNGQLIALHENYVDMYPDSPLWNENDLLVSSEGKYQKAWADSKHISPSKIMKYAKKNMTDIKAELGARACFLDVHSTHLPWWRTDYRSGIPFSGTMKGTWKFNNDLWAYARENYQGPVFGEGFSHSSWLHSGNLDSVMAQANFKSRMFVDFILLKIRPLQINHGAGYYERWIGRGYKQDWARCPLSPDQQDLYQCQQVAFQTAATVDDKIKFNITLAARAYYLLRPLVGSLVDSKVTSIDYHNGAIWLDPSQAILSSVDSNKRLKLTFDNKTEIYVNLDKTAWTIDGKHVSSYGFVADGPEINAYSGRNEKGLFLDYFKSDSLIFLDPRNYDWGIDPLGSWFNGRNPKHSPLRSNRGDVMISMGAIASDIAVACVKKCGNEWLLRFFPQRSSGTVVLKRHALKGKITQTIALDKKGNPVPDCKDKIIFDKDSIIISHRDPEVWSYLLK